MSVFPKNLAYSLKELGDAGFTKQKVKVLGDKTSVDANGTVRFLLPRGGLVDFRSLVLFFTGATAGTGSTSTSLHFPRYSSSLIQSITITANNTTLCSINEYGFLYNALMDFEGADISQTTKRSPELFDPTIKWTSTAADGGTTVWKNENPITGVMTQSYTDNTANDAGVNMCVNNWLGLISSLSTPVIDLFDLGDVYVNITFSPATVLYHSSITTSAPTITNPNFTLSNMYITIDKIAFQSSEYYKMKTDQLISPEGLKLAYYDYWTVVSGAGTKSSGFNVNFSVNSASLDQLIATFRRSDYTSYKPLVIYKGNIPTAAGAGISLDQYNANPIANSTTEGTTYALGFAGIGDGFANSYCFQRPANDLLTSQWSINSVAIDPYGLTPIEIFQKNLQYTGFQNLDLGSSGCHCGMKSILHFLKYYFVDICSLENISGDNQMWVSGMNGLNGGINVNYAATFATTNTGTVAPYIFCRSTKRLTIRSGRIIEIL